MPGRRGGRRINWITEALAPLEDQLQPQQFKTLTNALSLIAGVEALVVMQDVCELPTKDAKRVLRWTAQALLSEATRKAKDP
jgi:hypothetical protein